jgi:hypothetical protein
MTLLPTRITSWSGPYLSRLSFPRVQACLPSFLLHAGLFLGFLFDPEDGGVMFLRNVGRLSPDWWLSPRNWLLLEKPRVAQPLKNFPKFYGTRIFITEFARALHWSQSWARSMQSTLPHPSSLKSILIFSSDLLLGLPKGLFPSGFPIWIHLLSKRATCPAYLIIMGCKWEAWIRT